MMYKQEETRIIDFEPLGVTSVLAGTLPATLLTDAAPKLYTIEAVFNHRASAKEQAAIESEGTRILLSAAGFDHVTLAVVDRRLQIKSTNLQQLRDGLATVIARILDDISSTVERQRRTDAEDAQSEADRQLKRGAAVVALARSVRFDLDRADINETIARDAHLDADTDRDQLQNWDSEGGYFMR